MIFNNITSSIFKKLLDGTIAAGNAKKLGDKRAGAFHRACGYVESGTVAENIQKFINSGVENGYFFATLGVAGLPSYDGGACVRYYIESALTAAVEVDCFNIVTGRIYHAVYNTSTKTVGEWKQTATTADLNALQTIVDNIQSMGGYALSTAGWYRIAEYTGDVGTDGTASNSCLISLRKASGLGETYLLRLRVVRGNVDFKEISTKALQQSIPYIRYTYDSEKAYIEIYKSNGVAYGYHFNVFDIGSGTWKVYTKATATAETVDGVTVATTYTIPTDATPATSADLANYLPLSGGTITGDLTIGDNTQSVGKALSFCNSARKVIQVLGADGIYYAHDVTNDKTIYGSSADGTNVWYGTATGNLPLTGGMIHNDNSQVPLTLSNNRTSILLPFYCNGTLFGRFGFGRQNNPVFVTSGNVVNELHHDGNSQKIAFTESDTTAPSDTTALWAHL